MTAPLTAPADRAILPVDALGFVVMFPVCVPCGCAPVIA